MVAWTGNTISTSATNTSVTGNWIGTSTRTGTITGYYDAILPVSVQPSFQEALKSRTAVNIPLGWRGKVNMPDGSFVQMDRQGNYKINDDHAKVVYRACRRREFNRYLNASDLLEEFILDVGRLGVKQHQVVEGLFGAFLHWMILKAAKADGDPVPDGILPLKKHPALLERSKPKPNHCRVCGRFIENKMVRAELPFCNDTHILIHMQKKGCL